MSSYRSQQASKDFSECKMKEINDIRDELIRIRTILDIDTAKGKQMLTNLIKEIK